MTPKTPKRERSTESGSDEGIHKANKRTPTTWTPAKKAKLATSVLEKGLAKMSAEDWKEAAADCGMEVSQCRDQFKPKRANIRSHMLSVLAKAFT